MAANRTPNHEKRVKWRKPKKRVSLFIHGLGYWTRCHSEGRKKRTVSRIWIDEALGMQETSSSQSWGARLEPNQQR